MFVIVGDKIPEALEWTDPTLIPPKMGLLRALSPSLTMSLGGRPIKELLYENGVMLDRFSLVQGLWVQCGELCVYAAGNPMNREEIRTVGREYVRRESL